MVWGIEIPPASMMKHRIRAAALVLHQDRLLLIKSRIPQTGEICWVPPGGGVEGEESVFDCARRETFEEAGIAVELGRVVYWGQFIDEHFAVHHFELFILCNAFSGEPTIANNAGKSDEMDVLEARFLSRQEMADLTVYPELLKDEFWEDFGNGFPEVRFLGVRRG